MCVVGRRAGDRNRDRETERRQTGECSYYPATLNIKQKEVWLRAADEIFLLSSLASFTRMF